VPRSPRHGLTGRQKANHEVLKIVKRQMYGRGEIDLLQARMLGAA
jgi:transposase